MYFHIVKPHDASKVKNDFLQSVYVHCVMEYAITVLLSAVKKTSITLLCVIPHLVVEYTRFVLLLIYLATLNTEGKCKLRTG
jgi:hypothetical protein